MTDGDAAAGGAEGEATPQEPRILYLIHDASFEPDSLAYTGEEMPLQVVPFAEREALPFGARVLLCLGDEQIRDLTEQALERSWEVGVLPHPEAHRAMAALGVKGEVQAVLQHYLQAPVVEADAVTCNDELVFSSVVVGRVLSLRPWDINRPQTVWSMFRGAMKGLGKLHLASYKLTTGKERSINLAALGLVALSNTQSGLVGRNFAENLSVSDGRMALLAWAPRSIFGYLLFLLRLLLPGRISLAKLPPSLGLVQSDRLVLEAGRAVEYLLDGKPVSANSIEFRVLEGKLRLLPGPAIAPPRGEEQKPSDKETVRLNDVPVGEAARSLLGKSLPLFSHASEEEYRELFVSLRDNASVTSSFQVLMVLSVLLALTGLYANSAPVIIGAMILAPLMSPIVSLAMGLARTEVGLIRNSLRTLAVGIAWGLACAVLLAWAMPLEVPTAEMRARMSPTLLDLLVAVISGAAGAYANAKEEIAKSLAGVAIAVALVPPLSVAGIGLGWGDWDMARGALLLLTTNLVGMALAGSATFLVLGFAPFHRARKGMGITLLIMLVISAPLYIAFRHLVERDAIFEQVPTGEVILVGQRVSVGDVRVTLGQPHVVKVVLSAPGALDHRHVDELKQMISERLDQTIELEAQFHIRR